ncbi:urease accessory protein UreD [Eoetvoesiella caeni]|uniref:Urease accessory protein UreD n=1 Tax=Eoetvoesiella caeni TaxID=645616 RepID=A0A366HH43_9BURK|nr:urease accessory protein UreD [Eoetvoesiella caeni]MCI2808065.1 urease accessory protein UreD [Eoetvoesiella caeni]NYT53932.1 urease accessory protein UreD [Eoetvoesiella caeni]RBP41985.1 urease accessory protein [Eoetvoesiella caeni]
MNGMANEWQARLALSFASQGQYKTVLADRWHEGPLLVQKALYPEGPGICHVAILHPPSGIAGGDVLTIDVHVGQQAHAVLATPGATRWYKSNGRNASQTTTIHVVRDARIDWLPQENIYFEGTDAHSATHVQLQTGASAIGWEMAQLGSIDSDGHWNNGRIGLNTQVYLDGSLVWIDAGELGASDRLRHAANGLDGFSAMGTLWGFGTAPDQDIIEQLADTLPWTDCLRAGITCLPQKHEQALILVRAVGTHMEDVRNLLVAQWTALRPLLMNTPAVPLRLWTT